MRLALVAFCILLFSSAYPQTQDVRRIDSLNLLCSKIERSDLNAADSMATLVLRESREIGYKNGEGGALSNLAQVQVRRGNNKLAVEQLFAALKIYESQKELQMSELRVHTMVRLAGALYYEHDFERSLIYLKRATLLARENNYFDLLGLAYRIRGEWLCEKGSIDSSLYYFTEAANIFARRNDDIRLASVYLDIGVNYYFKDDLRQAIIFTRKSYEISRRLNMQADYAPGLHNIGEYYFLLGQYREGLVYLDSSQYYAEKFHQFTSLQFTYAIKAKLFTATKSPDSASLYYEKLIAIKDSILNDTYKKELASVQTSLDLYRHEAENKILVKEKSIATLYRNLAIIGVIALISILGLVLLRQRLRVQNQVKQKLEHEVQERTSEILEQKATIEDMNLRLQLSLHRARVDPHFVFNVLNSIQHLVLEKKPAEASDHLARLSRLARYILEKSSLDEVTVREEITMLEQYIRLEQLRLDNRFQYEIECDVEMSATLPAMLIQPYVENAIVHGFANQKRDDLVLRIFITEDQGSIVVRIEDNGSGRNHVPRRDGHQSIGSSLGQQRLEILSKLHRETYQLAIHDLNPGHAEERGTQVILRIPQKAHQPVS